MKKGVKISLYTLLGVFLALFFIFLLSFDFTPKEAYEVNKSVSEVRKDFDEILRKSIDESKTIKVLNISLDNEFLNNFINANKNENNVDFTSDQWFLKGTKFEVKGERFVLTLYANYSGVINYRFKISPPPPKGQPLDDVVVTVKLQNIETVEVSDLDAESTTSFLPSLPFNDSINSLNVPVNNPSSTARS